MTEWGSYLTTGMVMGLAFFLLFYNLAEDLLEQELGRFDQVITLAITSIRSPMATQFMKLLTDMGSIPVMAGITVLAMIYLVLIKKHNRESGMLIIALGGAAAMNYLLKQVFQRNRPDLPALVQAAGYSFPSGHAMVSFVFYGMLAFLLWANVRREVGVCILFATALLVLGIGISRIYLGVHYPSDVLAGYAAGGFWLTGCILALESLKARHKKPVKS